MKKILVTGGAGYIGSFMVRELKSKGFDPVILDNLSQGHDRAVAGFRLEIMDLVTQKDKLDDFLQSEKFDGVIHMASFIQMGESYSDPAKYYENNVLGFMNLLDSMKKAGTSKIIISSSAGVYGNPTKLPIAEDDPKNPLNPYGETKYIMERMLEDYDAAYGIKFAAIRYFNAAGAALDGSIGENHSEESHLIPNIIKSVLEGKEFTLFGDDYLTPDGTCIRDYVHVSDLASAHGAAMARLLASEEGPGKFEAFNLGSENGFSVREVVQACERAVGHTLSVTERGRRPADPPRLVADSSLAKEALGFKITHSLESIVKSALEWEKKRRALITTSRKAVFLDRDGTINEDPGYIADPDLIKVYDGVGRALAKLKEAGYLLIVISNQSGVARGLIPEGALDRVHARLNDILTASGAAPDYYELCLHRPEDHCECRKPKPKLIFNAAMKLGIDISESYMIGDKPSDIGTGKNAGCKGILLVRTGHGWETEKTLKPGEVDFVGDSLEEAANWILRQET
ncbi:MAG TPA: UDP-glucose 4-epimerase GalE [Bdellovibrionales bacterium]|nr:UDP-glucose 4-epimerase GalE [Bdellovibrionales bacterium]